ncbi:bifunctional 4-hydroxy-2-oxoglutarate aldolase/2-dehydro-3-deoxy-phosphogluconate aldolase [Thermanaerothrix sp. 4228-RoL]|uniref:Bifunctional 4-hydroxy-2-oxoglutarate aldolase/2-dehydro-3-deoxy-phosphogluconate aldolase n=1 Tax=Thermanaerothrix solaris TaxID=3058434 RepID=A0ABU3NK12_9CHLR|nr:bifunctional 4-hydroxy-2-oxoglutarate aldolase/2-dehydro-3-deoxy-phosphogluconate aldolase [Thermanaerothrix sp. 4228-RoL]MDT8897193.1 bifunctional 4-hydroxy-2-oxoglutarate aldolase/2-dehydro-3-deoxy-phosphogluconate aldolase [Thermanaerothrix sp. 4228-RoL]
MDRLVVYNTILSTRLVPLFYTPQISVAIDVTRCCLQAGAKVIEFTHRGEQAAVVFAALRQEFNKDCVLGVGSILDAPTAAFYIAQGADFIVSPIFDPSLASLCHRHGVAYIPGAASPTEIVNALSYGVEIIKLFPAAALGGPALLRSLRGPMPWVKILPTGGIPLEEKAIHAWLEAGAVAIGMGSELLRREWIVTQRFDLIEDAVRKALNWLHAFQSQPRT